MISNNNSCKRQLAVVESNNTDPQNSLVRSRDDDDAPSAQKIKLTSGEPSSPHFTSFSSRQLNAADAGATDTATTRAAWNTIGHGRELNRLIEKACSKPVNVPAFIRDLEANNFDINDPQTLNVVLKRFNNKTNLDHHIGELLIYIVQNYTMTRVASEIVMSYVVTWGDDRIRTIFGRCGVTFNFHGEEKPEIDTIKAPNQTVPLFFLSNARRLATDLVDHLIAINNFKLLSDLVLLKEVDEENTSTRYIEKPLTAIMSSSVLNHLELQHGKNRHIKELLATSVTPPYHEPTSLQNFRKLVNDVTDFREKLEQLEQRFQNTQNDEHDEAYQEIESHVIKSLQNNEVGMNPLKLYCMLPLLNSIIENPATEDDADYKEEPIDFVHYVLSMSVHQGKCFLHDPVCFQILLYTLENLIDHDHCRILEMIFESDDDLRRIPLATSGIPQCAYSLFDKLIKKKQFDTIDKILSQTNLDNETALFATLDECMPVLMKLAIDEQFKMLEKLLCMQNNQGMTPLHRSKTVFQTIEPLLFKFIRKDKFDSVRRILSMQTHEGKSVITFKSPSDFFHIFPCISLLIEKEQFQFIRELFSLCDQSLNTFAHLTDCFPTVLSIMGRLADANQFDLIETILSKQNSFFQTPLYNPTHFNAARNLLLRLCSLGQEQLVQRLWIRSENRQRDCKGYRSFNK